MRKMFDWARFGFVSAVLGVYLFADPLNLDDKDWVILGTMLFVHFHVMCVRNNGE